MEKCQVIKCKCGAIFAACIAPECYTDSEWLKDVKKYSKEGCEIDTIPKSEFAFGKCSCEMTETKADTNQLWLIK